MNAIPAELDIRLEHINLQLIPQHVPVAMNLEADPLSRLSEGMLALLPYRVWQNFPQLKVPAPCRTADWLKAWPKELAQSLRLSANMLLGP
eukprot:6095127-Amphidinium_carterae.2